MIKCKLIDKGGRFFNEKTTRIVAEQLYSDAQGISKATLLFSDVVNRWDYDYLLCITVRRFVTDD